MPIFLVRSLKKNYFVDKYFWCDKKCAKYFCSITVYYTRCECVCLFKEDERILGIQNPHQTRNQGGGGEMEKESIFTQDTNQLFAEKDSQCNPQVSRGLTWRVGEGAGNHPPSSNPPQNELTRRNTMSDGMRHNSPEVRYISTNTRYSISGSTKLIPQQYRAIEQECPSGTLGRATWLCTADGWLASGPDLSDCVSTWLTNLAAELGQGQALNKVGMDLSVLTESQPLYGGDIQEIIKLVEGMIRILETQLNSETDINDRRFISEQLMENLVNIFNNIINKREINAWFDLPSELRLSSLSSILEELETAASILADNAETDFQFDLRTQNVAGAVRILSENFDENDQVFSILDYPNTEMKLVIPKGSLIAVRERNVPTRVIVIQVNFPAQVPLKNHVVNSEIVSVTSDAATMSYFHNQGRAESRQAIQNN